VKRTDFTRRDWVCWEALRDLTIDGVTYELSVTRAVRGVYTWSVNLRLVALPMLIATGKAKDEKTAKLNARRTAESHAKRHA
jgi:hypothetical protein